ncbi:hypothetical protein HGB07_00165 [Candidatus Roizmanbacteria bacterium]|nr:hypothetical protein [Candidatus Roizmanbacteria bacterium]
MSEVPSVPQPERLRTPPMEKVGMLLRVAGSATPEAGKKILNPTSVLIKSDLPSQEKPVNQQDFQILEKKAHDSRRAATNVKIADLGITDLSVAERNTRLKENWANGFAQKLTTTGNAAHFEALKPLFQAAGLNVSQSADFTQAHALAIFNRYFSTPAAPNTPLPDSVKTFFIDISNAFNIKGNPANLDRVWKSLNWFTSSFGSAHDYIMVRIAAETQAYNDVIERCTDGIQLPQEAASALRDLKPQPDPEPPQPLERVDLSPGLDLGGLIEGNKKVVNNIIKKIRTITGPDPDRPEFQLGFEGVRILKKNGHILTTTVLDNLANNKYKIPMAMFVEEAHARLVIKSPYQENGQWKIKMWDPTRSQIEEKNLSAGNDPQYDPQSDSRLVKNNMYVDKLNASGGSIDLSTVFDAPEISTMRDTLLTSKFAQLQNDSENCVIYSFAVGAALEALQTGENAFKREGMTAFLSDFNIGKVLTFEDFVAAAQSEQLRQEYENFNQQMPKDTPIPLKDFYERVPIPVTSENNPYFLSRLPDNLDLSPEDLTNPDFQMIKPFFVDVQSDADKGSLWKTNREAVPYVWTFDPRSPNPNYRFATIEKYLYGDSGTTALAGATIATTEEQAKIYVGLATSVLKIHQSNPNLLSAWNIVQKTIQTGSTNSSMDVFNYYDQKSSPDEKLVSFTGDWQKRITELSNLLSQPQPQLKFYHHRWIEFLAHSVNVGKIMEEYKNRIQ